MHSFVYDSRELIPIYSFLITHFLFSRYSFFISCAGDEAIGRNPYAEQRGPT